MEIPEDFGELLKKMAECFGDKKPESDDPADYPRSVKIKDDRTNMLLEELQVKKREMHNAMSRMDVAWHEHEAFKSKTFLRLKELHPNVEIYEGVKSGCRFFKYKGEWWFVGWGGEKKPEKPLDEKPEQVKGWLDSLKPGDFGPSETKEPKPPDDTETASA